MVMVTLEEKIPGFFKMFGAKKPKNIDKKNKKKQKTKNRQINKQIFS